MMIESPAIIRATQPQFAEVALMLLWDLAEVNQTSQHLQATSNQWGEYLHRDSIGTQPRKDHHAQN